MPLARSHAAGPRILRQATDYEHEARCAECFRLVHGAAVVVARGLPVRVVGDEHATATIAGEIEARIANDTHRAIKPDGRNLIAPRIDGANAVPRASIDNLGEVALLANGRGV